MVLQECKSEWPSVTLEQSPKRKLQTSSRLWFMPPDKLALQIHDFCGQLGKECFELFSIWMERKNTINCICAAPRHRIVSDWILTKTCGFQFTFVIRIEQVNMHCNYISNTWKLLLHKEKFPSLNTEGKFFKQVTLWINGKF